VSAISLGSAKPPKTGIENVAKADFAAVRGTLAGTFEDTWTENDGYDVLTEEIQGSGSA
jgi:hypothetical protein